MTARCRILACGSLDGGDDAAGLEAVRRLSASVMARATIEEVGQLSAEHLLDDARGTVRLVVDCIAGAAPGEVLEVPLCDLPGLERRLQPGSSHALSIGQAVALADRLGGVGPADRFIGIGGEAFGLGARKSPAVLAGLPELIGRIAERVP
jgi:hydrogenase maturation protease